MRTSKAAPFRVGDRVRGMSYVHPDRRRWEKPEPFEGVVVQVGSGYAGVDAEHSFVWTRLADHTERQSLICETELVQPAGAEEASR
ncbi:hypothetical protein [Streptomyces alkaliterrae]|uniref:Nitrogen fixation protein NifZ n=1 Tax=Streptomyces alkaliterrae TaxID=2213162 RepID=A0A5P0YSZ6_9ACTN|nr:hypothetical protein [Streptomyces alkaliterrae]MBB1261388.1 hypothetical protein [Streptomyces alkaliterrae]MQS03441.1 hypothetical protein [Streptomyces alkaliterrae]